MRSPGLGAAGGQFRFGISSRSAEFMDCFKSPDGGRPCLFRIGILPRLLPGDCNILPLQARTQQIRFNQA